MQALSASDSPRRRRRGRGAYLPDRLGSSLPASAQIGLRRRTPLTPRTVVHPKSTAKVRYKRGVVLLLRGSWLSPQRAADLIYKPALQQSRRSPPILMACCFDNYCTSDLCSGENTRPRFPPERWATTGSPALGSASIRLRSSLCGWRIGVSFSLDSRSATREQAAVFAIFGSCKGIPRTPRTGVRATRFGSSTQ
jgi:hypothetical protein